MRNLALEVELRSRACRDLKSFVYERASILQYITQKGKNGRVACPNAGTAHIISAEELTAATNVIRAKKRALKAATQAAAAGPSGTPGGEAVVLDDD